jgi:CCR4-NOT transcriptional regulation complex NOT5 subunit
VKPKCPISARDQALSKIGHADINIKNVNVIASYTFYLDPRNFTTFRMKLNPKVNTVVLFSLDSDIQYAVLNNNPPQSQSSSPVAEQAKGSRLSLTSSKKNNTQAATAPPPVPPSQRDSESAEAQELTWLTPQSQDSISYTPIPRATPTPASPLNPNLPPSIKTNQNQSKYVLVRPGKEMHNSLVDKRVSVRAGSEGAERDLFAATTQPNKELIEYAQGLLLTGYLGEGFMYVVEWVWR